MNQTNQTFPKDSKNSQIVLYIQIVIAITGVLANTLIVLVAHIKDPLGCYKTPPSWFILNIGVIDAVVSSICIARSSTLLVHLNGCYKIEQRVLIILLNVYNRLANMTCPAYFVLSVERFCSVAFPLWHRTRITTRVCWRTIAGLWVMYVVFQASTTIFVVPIDTDHFDVTLLIHTFSFFIFSQLCSLATFIALRKQRNNILARQNAQPSSIARWRTKNDSFAL